MNSKFNKVVLYGLGLLVFLITSIFLCIIDFKNASRLELGLLYILQFFASITIVFMYSRDTTKKDFQQDNKRYAESSFRRIDEIDNAVKELEKHLVNKTGESEIYSETKLSFMQLKQTISSSKHDWEMFFGQKEDSDETKNIPNLDSISNEVVDVTKQEVEKRIDEKTSKGLLFDNEKYISDYINKLHHKTRFLAQTIYDRIIQDGYFDIQCFLETGKEESIKRNSELMIEPGRLASDSGPLWFVDERLSRIAGLYNDKQYSYTEYSNALLAVSLLTKVKIIIFSDVVKIFDKDDQEEYLIFTSRMTLNETK